MNWCDKLIKKSTNLFRNYTYCEVLLLCIYSEIMHIVKYWCYVSYDKSYIYVFTWQVVISSLFPWKPYIKNLVTSSEARVWILILVSQLMQSSKRIPNQGCSVGSASLSHCPISEIVIDFKRRSHGRDPVFKIAEMNRVRSWSDQLRVLPKAGHRPPQSKTTGRPSPSVAQG